MKLLTFFLMQLLIRKQNESAPLHGLRHSLAEKNPERRKSRAQKHTSERERARARGLRPKEEALQAQLSVVLQVRSDLSS
jgi:hypothetical protein